jgi:hypothetical protein
MDEGNSKNFRTQKKKQRQRAKDASGGLK